MACFKISLLVGVLGIAGALAQTTTLYIPDIGQAAISASIVNVGGNGLTTWTIGPGTPTATETALAGSGTLVSLATYASLRYTSDAFTLVEECTITTVNDVGRCYQSAGGTAEYVQLTIHPVTVQTPASSPAITSVPTPAVRR